MFRAIIPSLCIVVLTGCTAAPDFTPPDYQAALISDNWTVNVPHRGEISSLLNWWQQSGDTQLVNLIESAQSSHPRLESAKAALLQSRAQANIDGANLSPAVSGNAGVQRGNSLGLTDTAGTALIATQQSAGFDMRWELDLFGGTRAQIDASIHDANAAENQWYDARISLAAEVATLYCDLQFRKEMTARYNQEVSSMRETLKLTRLKVKQGVTPSNDLLGLTASLSQAITNQQSNEMVYRQGIVSLAMLTQLPPEDVNRIIEQSDGIADFSGNFAYSFPADVLSQRPDIRAAQNRLAAATSRVGVAKAARYPSISIAGMFNINKLTVGNHATSNQIWSIAPSLSVPLYNAGSLQAQEDKAWAAVSQAEADFQVVLQQAVEEVETNLIGVVTYQTLTEEAKKANKDYARYFEGINQSYTAGRTSLLELENARRQYLQSSESYYSALLEQSKSWIRLYKALGGGNALSSNQTGTTL